MSYNITDFIRKMDSLSTIYKRVPNMAATEAVRFIKNRFVQQAWIDYTTNPWKRRKIRNNSRAILVKSGALKRSIRKVYVGTDRIIIGTDIPYAKAHNDGFHGTVTVPAHSRKNFSSTKTTVGTGRYSITTRREHKRTRTTYEHTSTTMVKSYTKKMNLPRRQFIGDSYTMNRNIERQIAADMIRVLKS